MTSEIGLGLQSDKTAAEYAALAMQAEALGFNVLSVFSDLLYQPPLYALLEMARVTSRVRLGAACWNPYTLHPYEIAGQLAVLDAASAGRAYLGLARGSWLGQIGLAQPRPVAHLREALAMIDALLAGRDEEVPGELFPLAQGTRLRYPLPAVRPRVLIGTWGARTAALAGQVADEVKIGGTANPAMVGVMQQRINNTEVGVVVGAVTVVDEDARAARARARTEVAMYLDVVAGLDPTLDLPPDMLPEVGALLKAGDPEAAGRRIPDDVLDLFAFSGTPDAVAAQAQALVDAGAHRVEFGTPHGLTDAGGVELLGRRVLPQLR